MESNLYVSDLEKLYCNVDWSPFRNRKVLITGGLGLIGGALVDSLVFANCHHSLGIRIYVADVNETLYYQKYSNFDCVKFLKYDALEKYVFDEDYDFIVIAAGLANPNLYTEKPIETMVSNSNGLLNILSQVNIEKTKKIVYISSSEIYGLLDNKISLIETDNGIHDLNSIRNSYGITKMYCEMLCKSFSLENKIPVCIVRPGHIFGPSASPNDTRLSSEFLRKSANHEDLVLKSDGLTKRSYCYSIDCAFAILIALSFGVPGESYNIGHDEMTSILDFSKCVARIGKVNLSFQTSISKNDNPMKNACLNNNKIKKIGYHDIFSVEEGIEHTINILKEIRK